MKSKILTGIMAVILVFAISSSLSKVYGYSNSDYSIDIPSNYTAGTDGSFTNDDNTIMFMVSKEHVGEIEDFEYNDENLELLVNQFEEGLNLSGATVKDRTNSKITTFSKNNYKCFSFALELDISGVAMYTNTYMFLSGEDLYSLTSMTQDKADSNSTEVKSIINSFTVNDFENMDESSSDNKNTEKEDDEKEDDDKEIEDEDKKEDKDQKEEKTTKNENKDSKEKSEKDDNDEEEKFLDTTMGHVVLYGGIGLLVVLIIVVIVVKIASKNSKNK